MKIGVIGCGNISSAYLKNLPGFANVEVAAVADLDVARAQAKAAEFKIAKACSVDALLADPAIELVLNLTIPQAHAAVDLAAIAAGKHVYSEKPLALDRAEGQQVLAAARAKGVRVGCAPDTVLGGGHQTCRMLIDHGAIGRVVAGTAFMMCPGHESWHPAPEFYYQRGGGPLFDMGPYYLHALIMLLGPVRRVTGSANISFPERLITSQPKSGTRVPVEVPTHLAAVLDFVSGPIVTLITSFDVRAHSCPIIELYGTTGTLAVPDPNGFGGKVKIKRTRNGEWESVGHSHSYLNQHRGLGVADLAAAITAGRDHRANERIAQHALDLMQAIHEASATGRHIEVASRCERPAAMVAGLAEGVLD
ncbi:oxidoreductase [Planctomycetota bacterium]|nr:oxidoreductase [Planctomycetota bacterium]